MHQYVELVYERPTSKGNANKGANTLYIRLYVYASLIHKLILYLSVLHDVVMNLISSKFRFKKNTF